MSTPSVCRPAHVPSEEGKVTLDNEGTKEIPVVIPYIKGFSEQTRQAFGKYVIAIYFKPTNTLQLLVKPKDLVSKEKVVGPVYKIKCEECEVTYVGEMERSLKSRFNKYWRLSSTTSEVSKHMHLEQPMHSMELGNNEIVTTESRWFERGVKEAIYERANPSLNRYGRRYNLTPVWDIIKKGVKADRPRRGVWGWGVITIIIHNILNNIGGTTD